jgi:predicted Rossmann-fold nucleotide-binding protein
MEAVSKGVNEVHGYSIGYTCKTFPSIKGNEFLSETIVTEDIYERLRLLISGSELFIIQKGGIGTLSELSLLLDIIRKPKASNPLIYLIGDTWKDIITFIEEQKFLNKDKAFYTVCKDYQELEEKLCGH